MRHGVGLKQLLQMRGPRPIRTEFEASVFLQAKAIMVRLITNAIHGSAMLTVDSSTTAQA